MSEHLVKNIQFGTPIKVDDLVDYEEGRVVSRTLSQNKALSVTLFAFDKGEEIGTHASGGDAMVFVLDGKANITIGDGTHNVSAGETIVMPAGIAHSLYAEEKFKMLLVVAFAI